MSEFHEITMAVSVAPGSTEQDVCITARPVRLFGGWKYERKRQAPHRGKSAEPGKQADEPPAVKEETGESSIKPMTLRAVLRQGRRLDQVTSNGTPLEDLWGEKDPTKLRYAEMQFAPICRTALEDPIAYLPDSPVGVGDTWKVTRETVFPLHQIAIGYLIHCVAVREKATCHLKGVRTTPTGRIAQIEMTGRRDPVAKYQVFGPPTGNYLQSRGSVDVNLDTGRLVKFHIERTVRFKKPPMPGLKATISETLTLKPATGEAGEDSEEK